MTLRAAIEMALRENRDITWGASSGPCVRIGADKLQVLAAIVDSAQICAPWAKDIREWLDGPEKKS